MRISHIIRRGAALSLLVLVLGGCKKILDIPDPKDSISTPTQFSSDLLANTALVGLYYVAETPMIPNYGWAAGGPITLSCGYASDELIDFQGPLDVTGYQFNTNTILASNAGTGVWTPGYYNIYQTNAIIDGLAASTGMSDSARSEYTGEAKFLRALTFFYLTNSYGDVPLVLSTDFNKTESMSRTPQAAVYKQIIQDLQDAAKSAASDFSVGKGERIRATRWAAFALLARVYLYQSDWTDAEAMADSVIAHTQLFSLVTDPAAVFNKNSNEAILQFQQNSSNYYVGLYNILQEGSYFVPAGGSVTAYLAPQQMAAFESGDLRLAKWVNTFVANDSKTYSAPYKYTQGRAQVSPGAAITQYYMVLRLAEQYLIRAEARAHNNNPAGAAADLNAVRARATLPPTTAATADDLLVAVAHERQTELFAEWGHRWFDLKRTGKALSVLSAIPLHAAINQNQLLFPIPATEITANNQLSQNPGY